MGGGFLQGGGGFVSDTPINDPFVPADGTQNITGSLTISGTLTVATDFSFKFTGQNTGLNNPNSNHFTLVCNNVQIMGVRHEGGAEKIGFFSTAAAAPVAKQTASGSRGGNAALASLLTALATYGLITDGTSA